MNKTILAISGLTKSYGSFKAVDNVSFMVNAGEVVGLLGPNGAGKTTTINMILGILEPTNGSIKILGKKQVGKNSEISKRINFAAVYTNLPANLTVYQNLYVFGLIYEVKDLRKKIQQLLKEFDLEEFADVKSGILSSGEYSRLNLAKAVINEPSLMLLDEPTASLDPSVSEHIREKIRKHAQKTNAAVLWTSHNMQEIEKVCDRVLFLSHGKIILEGDPRQLPAIHKKKDLEELFISIAREPLRKEDKL